MRRIIAGGIVILAGIVLPTIAIIGRISGGESADHVVGDAVGCCSAGAGREWLYLYKGILAG